MGNDTAPFAGNIRQIERVPTSLRKHREMLGYRYYDSMRVPLFANATISYQFFKDVQGKDTFRTNMTVGGYLPPDEVFEVKAIAMTFSPPVLDWVTMGAAADFPSWAAFSNAFKLGYWELHIGDKSYNKGPLHEIVATKSEYVWSAAAEFGGFEHQDTPFFKASGLYPLEVPVTLEKGIPFYVDVHWNGAISLAEDVTAPNMWIYCHLFGRRERRAIG